MKINPKDHSTVIRELETIPTKYRDVKMHLFLGYLYKASSLKRLAIKSYKEALLIVPDATEVIESLIGMGVDPADLNSTIEEGFKSKYGTSESAAEGAVTSPAWMQLFLTATASKRDFDIETSIATWKKLMDSFPQNSLLLRRTASALLLSAPLSLVALTSETNSIAAGASTMTRSQFGSLPVSSKEISAAQQLLSLVRRDDTLTLDGIDLLARILYQKEDAVELNKLAMDALEACESRPEGWLAAALFCALKGNFEKAAAFVEKAIQSDPKRSESFKVKGQLYLQQNNFEQALISFSQANSLEQDMSSFYGTSFSSSL